MSSKSFKFCLWVVPMATSGKYSKQYRTVPTFSFHEREPGREVRNMGNLATWRTMSVRTTGNVHFHLVSRIGPTVSTLILSTLTCSIFIIWSVKSPTWIVWSHLPPHVRVSPNLWSFSVFVNLLMREFHQPCSLIKPHWFSGTCEHELMAFCLWRYAKLRSTKLKAYFNEVWLGALIGACLFQIWWHSADSLHFFILYA